MPRTDGTSGNARRKQKVYQDILGRTFKTETYNWNGTVYSTSLASFNERDQVLRSRQYEGDTSSTTFQDTTATFDGHGRMASSHRPEQRDSSNNLKYTAYNYNADDSISSVTDGRGAVTNFDYNSNGLLATKSWSVPQNSSIHIPVSVGLEYDALGNRVQMTDETGITTYQYDELSQIVSETKQFNGLSNVYSLSYTYGLAGQLQSVTNPGGTVVSYEFDKSGKITYIGGSGFTDQATTWQGGTPVSTVHTIDQIATSMQYRAWGELKGAEFPDGREFEITFDNRLRPYEYLMPGKLEKRYSYFADGKISFATDLLDSRSDRSFSYDHLGRIIKAYAGHVARNEQPDPNLPAYYNEFVAIKNDYAYNAFSNPVGRKELNSKTYSTTNQYQHHDVDVQRIYENNRSVSGVRSWDKVWAYDADGRIIQHGDPAVDPYNTVEYDAAGFARKMKARDGGATDEKTSAYDGNGHSSRESMYVNVMVVDEEGGPLPPLETTSIKYHLRSTPLSGAIVSQIYENGNVGNIYIYAGSRRIAIYRPISGNQSKFTWEHSDPHGISGYNSSFTERQSHPAYPNEDLTFPGKAEFDPSGRESGRLPQLSELFGSGGGGGGSATDEVGGGIWENFSCTLDGVATSCGWLSQYRSIDGGGSVYETPPDHVASVWNAASRELAGIPLSDESSAERGLAFSKRGSRGTLPISFRGDGTPDGCGDLPIPCLPDIIVQVPIDPTSEPIVVQIAAIGFIQERKRVTNSELEKIIDDIKLIVKNSGEQCNEFIREVQNRMEGGESNPMDAQGLIRVLQEVHGEGGIWFDATINDGAHAYGGEGDRTIVMQPVRDPGNSSFWTKAGKKRYFRSQELKIANTALNEAFHHVGPMYGDAELYSAWARWKGLPEAEEMPRLPKNKEHTQEELAAYSSVVRRYITRYSGKFHAEMKRACNTLRMVQ